MSEELLDVIAAAVGRIESKVTETATIVEGLQRDMGEVKRDVATIVRRLEAHETRIETLEAR